MIEQYIYNRISSNLALQTILEKNGGGIHLYPVSIPRGIEFNQAMTFFLVNSVNAYPTIKSVEIQFTFFSKTHEKINEMSQAIESEFNEDNNQSDAGVNMVFSQKRSEFDLPYDFDEELYLRQASYYFKLR